MWRLPEGRRQPTFWPRDEEKRIHAQFKQGRGPERVATMHSPTYSYTDFLGYGIAHFPLNVMERAALD